MARCDYSKEHFEKVRVCGIECLFSDVRIERSTVPKGKYQYEIGGVVLCQEKVQVKYEQSKI